MKVLFVCNANVGRSQMAEAIFNSLCKQRKLKHSAESVALDDKHAGKKVCNIAKIVCECMNEAGIDLRNAKISKITKKIIKDKDIVVLMTKKGEIPDYVKEAKRLILWDIEDPKGRDMNFHRKIRDEIHIKVNRLIDELGS